MKILVVDDSNSMLEYIKLIFKDLGLRDIIVASNGQDAFDLFLKHYEELDMIFTDWNMPMMDGLSFIKRVRDIDTQNQVYITMVTTECDRIKVLEALEAGADNYVVKPFSSKRISTILDDYQKNKKTQEIY